MPRYTARFSRRTTAKYRPTFPDRNFVKFRLARNDVDLSLDSTGPILRRSFDLYPNCLYEVDPDLTKVPLNYNVYLGPMDGNQPYRRYMVYGAKIDWTIHVATNNQVRIATLVWDSQDWSPDALWEFSDYAEQRDRCKVYNVGAVTGGDRGIFRGSTYMGMSKIFNESKSALLNPGNDSDLAGYYNTNPLSYCQFRLIVEKVNVNTAANIPITCDYVVTFYTMLFDRNQNIFEVPPAPPSKVPEMLLEKDPENPDPENPENKTDPENIPTYQELLQRFYIKP